LVVQASRKRRDGLSHARQPSMLGPGSTGCGGSARSEPGDLCKCKGEGGRAVPEPVAPEQQENEGRYHYEPFHDHRPDLPHWAGLALDQEAWPEAYDSSHLGGTSRRDPPQTEAGFAFIRRQLRFLDHNHRCLNRWRAGTMVRNDTRQQEMQL
jgi:hypothetical protein